MKKVISYLIAFMMVITMVPCTAFASSSDCVHVWGEWEVYEDYTCYDRTAYRYCEECYDEETMTIPATTDHNWGEWDIWEEATCEYEGYKERYCKDCWECEEAVIPATGIHTWGEWRYEYGNDVTCINQDAYRYCYECYEEEAIEIPATTDHTWGEWSIWLEPTCWGTGNKDRECKACGEYEDIEIPATGIHKWGSWKIRDKATVDWSGSIYRECSECYDEQEKIINRIKSITLSKTKYVYDGNSKKPTVTVKDTAGKKLVKGTDYTVKYKNAKGKVVAKPTAVGKYTAVVTFKGNYSGTVSKQFTINPKATSITKLTKPAKKQIKVTWQKRTAQVTGYEIQYSTTKNFTKKTTKTVKVKNFKTNTKTIKQLKAKKKYWVKIRTYKTVNGKTYYSTWSKARTVTTK